MAPIKINLKKRGLINQQPFEPKIKAEIAKIPCKKRIKIRKLPKKYR